MSAVLRLLLTLAVLVLPPVIASMPGSGDLALPLAVFFTAVILWLTELLPLPVTALLIPVLISLYGIMPAAEAFAPFGSDILFLFLGCFFLARAMQKHRWDTRMAYWLLSTKLGDGSPAFLSSLVAGMSFVLSMWISNTAACAMLTPICLAVSHTLGLELDSRDQEKLTIRMLLACAFAATMGGLATPVGTPPNLLAIEFLRNAGISVNFFQWMFWALPISLVMLITLLAILHIRYPVQRSTAGVSKQFAEKLHSLGPITREEISVCAVFFCTVLLWILPGLCQHIFGTQAGITQVLRPFSLSIVGVLAAVSLFVIPGTRAPLLVWEDSKHVDWGTILLFGGGLSLGMMLGATGITEQLGAELFNAEYGLSSLVALAVICAVIFSEFGSNTASASVMIPIIIGASPLLDQAGISILALVLASTFGASFGFMLPVSTPPNAIIYGTEKVPIQDMIRTGIYFDIAGILLISATVILLTKMNLIG